MSLMTSIFGGESSSNVSDLFHSPVPPKVTASQTAFHKSDDSSDEIKHDAAGDEPLSIPNNEITKEKTVDKSEEERTIFVGNLPPDISRKSLAGIFKECGKVTSSRLRSVAVAGVKLPPSQMGNQNLMRKVCANTGKLLDAKQSAQGYVVFASLDAIEKALQFNNTPYQSHTLRVDRAKPTIDSSLSVFVGNLPYGAEEESLRSHFLHGLGVGDDVTAVTGVRIIRDRETQKCKGFGYVTFSDASYVPMALEMQNSTYMKREIRVMVSGKRFKGKRGDDTPEKRSFEGQRATMAKKTTGNRKSEGETSGKTKRRRGRSEKKGPAKSGLSKRAATERKVDKRVKKLEKRATRGMGKKTH